MNFSEYLEGIKPLTVGQLRQAMEGLSDETQVLIGAPLGHLDNDWALSDWWNVEGEIGIPPKHEFSALTLFIKNNYDSRQF